MRGKALSLGLMCLGICLSGCGFQNQIIDPNDIMNPSDEGDKPNEVNRSLDHLILETHDKDLFYLDEELNQFNLTDQVDHFEYDESHNILKVKKQSGQWVIWHLDNQKPHFIEQAEQVLPTIDRKTTYFTGEQNVGLYKLSNNQEIPLTNEIISMVDVTPDGEFVVFLTDSNTLKIMNSNGNLLRAETDVIAYRLDKASQSVTVWSDEEISILQLEDNRVTTAKYFLGVTDWLYSPYYSNEFETLAYMIDLDLEAGMGTLAIETTHPANAVTIPDVMSYTVSDDGMFVYYVTKRSELYQLDLVENESYFLGGYVNQMNLEVFETFSLYRNELGLHAINLDRETSLISDDVYQYDANDHAIVYTDSLHDLYLIQNNMVEAIAKNIQSFSLGENGVFYEHNNQMIYYGFEGQKEIIVDSSSAYKSIFHRNTSLYQASLTMDDLIGSWKYGDEINQITYTFNEDQTYEAEQRTSDKVKTIEGTYTVLVTDHGSLNLSLTDGFGKTTFMSVSSVDRFTVDVAEDEHVYQLKRLVE